MLSEAFHHTSSCSRILHRRSGIRQLSQQKFGCHQSSNPLHKIQPSCDGNLRDTPQSLIELSTIPSSELDGGVFSTEDIVVGLILGILLALMTSFLQGRRSQNDFVLWNKNESGEDMKITSTLAPSADEIELEFATNATTILETSTTSDQSVLQESRSAVVFDGDDWKEMSRLENYVYYKRNLNKKKDDPSSEQKDEQKWVIVALLALFVPIFSVEFFFALSRQVLCGGGDNGLLSSLEAAQFLCSPVR